MLGAIVADVRVVNLDALPQTDNSDKLSSTVQSPTCTLEWLTRWPLEAVRDYWETLGGDASGPSHFLHVSTDEGYGILGEAGRFAETAPYVPNSPYACFEGRFRPPHVRLSTHLWDAGADYQLQQQLWPLLPPENLIPLMIVKALAGEPQPVGGDGKQVRDWLYVTYRCEAILTVLANGRVEETCNIGGNAEKQSLDVFKAICAFLDERRPREDGRPHESQIALVADRHGHDRRYAIDASKLQHELGWVPAYTFERDLAETVDRYLGNQPWVQRVLDGSYRLERIGVGA